MSTYDQQPYGGPANPFDAGEFADNPEQRCPCILLLDTSGSMMGEKMDQLNAGVRAFKDELMQDGLASKRVEVAIVTFGPVYLAQDFVTADAFQPPYLQAGGDTPMGSAIIEGLETLARRKEIYRANGVPYNRPWVFLITDGAPTDSVHFAKQQLREGVDQKKFAFFAVAVDGADIARLTDLSPRKPAELKGLKFRELFQWLSSSLSSASRSSPTMETLALPPPTDWANL